MGFNASKENIMRFMQTVDEEIVDYDYLLMTGDYNAFEQLGILDSPVAKKVIIVTASGSNLYNCDMEKWTKKYVEKGIVVDLIIIGADTYVPELVEFSKATGGSVWQADDGAQASKYYLGIHCLWFWFDLNMIVISENPIRDSKLYKFARFYAIDCWQICTPLMAIVINLTILLICKILPIHKKIYAVAYWFISLSLSAMLVVPSYL